MWFSITAAAFLSMYAFAAYWKGCTKAGAISGLVIGTLISLFWLVFVYAQSAAALGICKALTGSPVLFASNPWPDVNSIVIALPIAFVVTILVSLMTKPPNKEHIEASFRGVD
jgi:SSS family solute:Na+ symporter